MNIASLAKDVIGLQKQSANNFFDTMLILQDQAAMAGRLWANVAGANGNAREVVDQWRTLCNKGLNDTRKFVDEGLASIEDYFNGLEQRKPSDT
jgi:hypothetical protein